MLWPCVTQLQHHLGGGAVHHVLAKTVIIAALGLGLANCGNRVSPSKANSGSVASQAAAAQIGIDANQPRSTIWDLFSNSDDPNKTVNVNKYI